MINIKPEFLDIVNYALCQAVDDYVGKNAVSFFRKVGEYHLDEALEREYVTLDLKDRPLENLIRIARYLESTGYMEKILINKLSESEAIVDMYGVSVTKSSADLLKAGKQPSHYMTNIMLAALRRLGIQAELKDVDFDTDDRHFRERWRILGPSK